MWTKDRTLDLLTAACLLALHAAVTSPNEGQLNWTLARDIGGVIAKVPGMLDVATVAIDKSNKTLFGYSSSAVDDCTLATEPPPPMVPFDDYRSWSIVATKGKMTPEATAAALGSPYCYTANGIERRVVQGQTERRILDIQYSPMGVMTDASLHSN